MSFTFRPAAREDVGLLIGVVGCSGSGKTFSAMRLAAGIAGDRPFAVIDTEAGRAKHYADQFRFDHGDLKPPFRPDAYADAIASADRAGYPVIVVDSASHEHAGDGGLLDWHEEELQRMAGDDWKRRDNCNMAAWIRPKQAHKKMVARLLQVRAHLILCFRAEEKVEMVRGDDGKMKIVPKKSPTGTGGWIPLAEKTLPYELTASLLLTADAPGVPRPIKLQEQHRELFPAGKLIDEECGRKISEWARGAGKKAPDRTAPAESDTAPAEHFIPVPLDAAGEGSDWPAWVAAVKNALGRAPENDPGWVDIWEEANRAALNNLKGNPKGKAAHRAIMERLDEIRGKVSA